MVPIEVRDDVPSRLSYSTGTGTLANKPRKFGEVWRNSTVTQSDSIFCACAGARKWTIQFNSWESKSSASKVHPIGRRLHTGYHQVRHSTKLRHDWRCARLDHEPEKTHWRSNSDYLFPPLSNTCSRSFMKLVEKCNRCMWYMVSRSRTRKSLPNGAGHRCGNTRPLE